MCVCVHILNVFVSVCTAIIWGGLAAPTRARPQSPGDEQEQEQEKEQEREGGATEGHRVLVVNRSLSSESSSRVSESKGVCFDCLFLRSPGQAPYGIKAHAGLVP